jgi:hypothetical protein
MLEHVLCDLEVIGHLRVQPKASAGIEVPAKAQRSVWSNASTLVNDLRDTGDRHMKVEGQFVHTETKRRHKILAEDFSGMNRRQSSRPDHMPS